MRDSLYQVLIDRVFEKEPEASHSEVVAYLASQYSSPMSGDRVERIVERFDSSFRNSYYVAQMKQFAENDRLLTAGKVFPDFQVFDTLGKTYTLADFKGKYLFVEFSASWCGWCKLEIPYLKTVYENTKGKNFVMFTVNMDEDREKWEKDVKEYNLPWPVVSDLKAYSGPVAQNYHVKGIPMIYLIDPEGKIMARDLRREPMIEYINKLFK